LRQCDPAIATATPPQNRRTDGKDQTQRTATDAPVHSFRTLLASLATLAKNRVVARWRGSSTPFELLTQPTPLQQRAFDLLGVPIRGL